MLTPAKDLASRLLAGERRALARAITLVESIRPDHRDRALALLETLAPHAGGSTRVGISGSPGVGKSTFIEALGNHLVEEGRRVAVLTIDPSSQRSGGSILGDKTRMQRLAARPEAFIRPSPAGGTLGGVARRTREALLLCEAAQFDVVLVETVGVGQSETAVADMTDVFMLLLSPASGDELQGIKRGIVELADVVVVNKADGESQAAAERVASEYRSALRLMLPRSRGWTVPVQCASALQGTGIAQAWQRVAELRAMLGSSSELSARRAAQARAWLWQEISESLLDSLQRDSEVRHLLVDLEPAVTAGRLPPTVAARQVLAAFLRRASPRSKP